MAEANEIPNHNNDHDNEDNEQPDTPATPAKRTLLERLPPRFRTKRWLIGGGVVVALLLVWMGDCGWTALNAPPPPPPTPVAAPTPTPLPPTSLLPDPPTPTPLPSQYAFLHFVNEMSACYQQRGLDANLQSVEADIMQDVPRAINELLRLYAAEECTEQEPWHQIAGRVGWMLRGSGVAIP